MLTYLFYPLSNPVNPMTIFHTRGATYTYAPQRYGK